MATRSIQVLLSVLSGLLLLCPLSCASSAGAADAAAAHDTAIPDGGGQDLDVAEETDTYVGVQIITENWNVPRGDGFIFGKMFRPAPCVGKNRCPGLLILDDIFPDSPLRFSDEDCVALSRATGAAVARFNRPGTGEGDLKSTGTESYGGKEEQDCVKDLLAFLVAKGYVSEKCVGILALGDALTVATGAVARFQDTNLKFVSYIIDLEGSTNRCFLTQSPYRLDDNGNHITGDGPGITESRCDFNLFDRPTKFPAGTSKDGKGEDGGTPNSYICNANAFPLLQAGTDCANDDWWKLREPKEFIPWLKIHYLRIQFLQDHRQPTRYACREVFRWLASSGNSASYQLNNLKENTPLSPLSEEKLVSSGVYLDIKGLGNSLGDDTFDVDGSHSKVAMSDFMQKVLPGYVKRMQERVMKQ